MWRKVFANQLKLWTSLPLPGRKFILVRNKSLHLLNAPFVLKTPSFEFPASVSIHVHVQKFCAYIRASNLHHSLKTNTPHKGFWALHRTANKQTIFHMPWQTFGRHMAKCRREMYPWVGLGLRIREILGYSDIQIQCVYLRLLVTAADSPTPSSRILPPTSV